MVVRKAVEDLHDPLEMGAERKGRGERLVWYRAGYVTEGFGFGGRVKI